MVMQQATIRSRRPGEKQYNGLCLVMYRPGQGSNRNLWLYRQHLKDLRDREVVIGNRINCILFLPEIFTQVDRFNWFQPSRKLQMRWIYICNYTLRLFLAGSRIIGYCCALFMPEGWRFIILRLYKEKKAIRVTITQGIIQIHPWSGKAPWPPSKCRGRCLYNSFYPVIV